MKQIASNMTVQDREFIDNMNGLSSESQRKLLLQKTKEYLWEYYEDKADKRAASKRNFHLIINDKDLRIQREEYVDCFAQTNINWTIWNQTHRIEGNYGELIYQLIKLINGK
jgi:hypothetical protein